MSFWLQRTVDGEGQTRLKSLLESGKMEGAPSAIVHDLDLMSLRWRELTEAFPSETLHAVAVKANPLLGVLRTLVNKGAGLEVASSGELALALAAGCPASRIVYDSPAKTMAELAEALELGIRINANSPAELERIDGLLRRNPSTSLVGLRLNPVVASRERESTTMVATARSKFGLQATAVSEALGRYPWLTGLHVHVGSQVATLDDLVLGARRTLDIAQQFPQITWLDIGGGLPARYRSQDPGLTPQAYIDALYSELPRLRSYSLITEVGRALHAGCGWAVTRVEYADERKAILHLGADFALRTAYQPESWYHESTVHDARGTLKRGEPRPVDLFGPLCFSGDKLAEQRLLPPIEPGDLVVIHDIGAYTLSMWSHYCSRPMPPVFGWTGSLWRTLREAETPQAVVKFWSDPTVD